MGGDILKHGKQQRSALSAFHVQKYPGGEERQRRGGNAPCHRGARKRGAIKGHPGQHVDTDLGIDMQQVHQHPVFADQPVFNPPEVQRSQRDVLI